jgi:transposase InsO family protein
VAEIFGRLPNGVGHRQAAMELRAADGVRIADKTALRMTDEMGLRCGIRRETGHHRHGSYRGKVGETSGNVLGRDFAADGPWQKMGTDVTEFKCGFGKACLAPVYDFGSREIAARSVSERPDLARQEEMLAMLVAAKPEGAAPVPHSDMGWQHRHAPYVAKLRENGFVQSMSRKGNCIDDGATEQVFGHIKDEFFRGRDWSDFESFRRDLEAYIHHWNHARRQARLRGPDPGGVPGPGPSGGRLAVMIYRVQVLGRSSPTGDPGKVARGSDGEGDGTRCRLRLRASRAAGAGVTQKPLWEEYRDEAGAKGSAAVSCTSFCRGCKRCVTGRNVTNHLEYKPGQAMEADRSGPTMKLAIEATGEVGKARPFVATLPYSQYTYVETTADMKQNAWLLCHAHACELFGGVAVRCVCDDLKTVVAKHPREGEVVPNEAYESLRRHHMCAVMPTGARRPRQKPSAGGQQATSPPPSPGRATRRSPRRTSRTPPSPRRSRTTTGRPSRRARAAAGSCSARSSRRSSCRLPRCSSRFATGSADARRIWISASSPTRTGTPCPSGASGPRRTCASPPTPLKLTSAAAASPAIPARRPSCNTDAKPTPPACHPGS